MRKFLGQSDKLTPLLGHLQNITPSSIDDRLSSIRNKSLIKDFLLRHSAAINFSDNALLFYPEELWINFRNFIFFSHIL
jgi:hypothetical protein